MHRSGTLVRFLLAGVLCVATSTAHAALFQFDVRLTTLDHLAQDSVGEFYYDVYNLTVTAPTPVSVSLTGIDFAPWVGAWDSEVLPRLEWENGVDVYTAATNIDSNGTPGTTVGFIFNALPGVLYQIAPATQNYNPTPLGDYSLIIETPVIADFPDGVPFSASAVVPLPPAMVLFVSALTLLWGRSAQMSRKNCGIFLSGFARKK